MSGRGGRWVLPCSNPNGRAVGLHLAVHGSRLVLVAPAGEIAVLDAEQVQRFESGVVAACAAVANAVAEAVGDPGRGADGTVGQDGGGASLAAAGWPAGRAVVVGPGNGSAPPRLPDGGVCDE